MTEGTGPEVGEDPTSADDGSGADARPGVEPARRGNVYLLPTATSAGLTAGLTTAEPAEFDPRLPGAGPGAARDPAAVDLPPPAADPALPADDTREEREDWAWVQEWREGREPVPWSTGAVLAGFSALVVGVAVWVLSAGLSDRPIVAILVNLLVAAGLAPAIWLSRGLPVLRWIAVGAAAGILIGWLSALMMLPMPTP